MRPCGPAQPRQSGPGAVPQRPAGRHGEAPNRLPGETPPDLPDDIQVLHRSNVGRVYTYILRGTAQQALERFGTYDPLFAEALPLTLEEIFIYEMGGEDYAVRDIVL